MNPAYVRRIRMRRWLDTALPSSTLPPGFRWEPWDDAWLDAHASVKYLSFAGSIDADIFPNLAGLTGCRMLMRAIRDCDGFCPQATWLLADAAGPIGAVQGVIEEGIHGGIQNVGVLPGHRRRGFGSLLVAKCLQGFRAAGATNAVLEVTAANPNAVRLYRHLGFKPYNSYFRERPRVAGAAR